MLAVLGAATAFVIAGCATTPSNTSMSDVEQAAKATESDLTSMQPFYVLVVGNDTRTGTVDAAQAQYADGNARSDTMILMRIDPTTYKITLVSIPRDTAATVGSGTMRINAGYEANGMAGAVDQTQKLTGVKVSYYFNMNFVQFEQFVDKIGGVTANVPIAMSLQDIVTGSKVSLNSGDQALNGSQALVLARVRKSYANDGEACRQIQDRQLVAAFIQKVASQPAAQSATYVDDLAACSETNMPTADLLKYVSAFVANKSKITVLSGTGPYQGSDDPAFGGWIIPRDEATWKQIISVMEAGGDPSTVVASPDVVAS